MNKFMIELLKRAYQNQEQTGSYQASYRARNVDDWFYNSEALRYLSEENYIEVDDDFDPDESNLFAISRPVVYTLTSRGLQYIKDHSQE